MIFNVKLVRVRLISVKIVLIYLEILIMGVFVKMDTMIGTKKNVDSANIHAIPVYWNPFAYPVKINLLIDLYPTAPVLQDTINQEINPKDV